VVALQLGGDPKQRAVDDGAMVIGQLEDACFRDQTAELNQMAGALAANALLRPPATARLAAVRLAHRTHA